MSSCSNTCTLTLFDHDLLKIPSLCYIYKDFDKFLSVTLTISLENRDGPSLYLGVKCMKFEKAPTQNHLYKNSGCTCAARGY